MLETMNGLPGVVTAWIEGVDVEGQPVVQWEGGPGPVAVYAVVWMGQPVDWSACRGLRAMIAFEDGDGARPVILGLLDAPPQPEAPYAKSADEAGTDDMIVKAGEPDSMTTQDTPEALHIRSEKELVLECGKAKIALRADGRVVIRGGYILSRSTGVNKVKGGSIQIN